MRHLKPLEIPVGHTTHQAVTVIEPGGNDSLGEHFGTVEVQQRSNVSQCAEVAVASANHIRDMTVRRQCTSSTPSSLMEPLSETCAPATLIPDDTSTFCRCACVPHNIASCRLHGQWHNFGLKSGGKLQAPRIETPKALRDGEWGGGIQPTRSLG